jgi:hypothetical protein
VTTNRNGAVTGRDRRTFFQQVADEYGDDTADAVRFASLPHDEQLHVLEHRRQHERHRED